VKSTSSRSETFLSDYHGRAAKLIGELALDGEGRLLAIRINWIVNTGAYLSTPGPLINTLPPGLHAINLYRIPVMYGRHRLALTNTTPTTAYRGAGRPNVCYLAERLVEEAARELKIDRLELRRRNFIPKDAFPYKTPHPHSVYDSGDPHGLLAEAVKQAGWRTFDARRASDPDGPRLGGEGTIGSRSMMAHGGALVVAAREVIRKGTELAAKDLEVAPNDLEFAKGRYRVKGTDVSIAIQDLARKHGSALDAGGEIPLPRSFPSGAHVAEAEVDPQTGA